MESKKRTTADKIKIFKSCFTGLENVYGTYDSQTGMVWQVKEPVTDKVILAHLTGKQPYGVYLLKKDRTNTVAVDFDEDDLNYPIAFVDETKRYEVAAYIERSKSKGYHVWIFFEETGVLSWKARAFVKNVLEDISKPETEYFPKQDSIDDSTSYGNFINAPLFGMLVSQGRTVFINPKNPIVPYPNQWDLLENVQRVSESKMDEILSVLNICDEKSAGKAAPATESNKQKNQILCFGLPPCAKRILIEGVKEDQRVACFRLATDLKRSGIPHDLALGLLNEWAKKNRPINGKQIITFREIESQTKYAYDRPYRGYGCEEAIIASYCSEDCQINLSRKKKSDSSKKASKETKNYSEASPEKVAEQ